VIPKVLATQETNASRWRLSSGGQMVTRPSGGLPYWRLPVPNLAVVARADFITPKGHCHTYSDATAPRRFRSAFLPCRRSGVSLRASPRSSRRSFPGS
jgi:hypothetical protein